MGDPMHTRKVCFDAVSHNSPVTLYDCHGMKGNQLWRYRKVGVSISLWNLEPCFKRHIEIIQIYLLFIYLLNQIFNIWEEKTPFLPNLINHSEAVTPVLGRKDAQPFRGFHQTLVLFIYFC